VQEHDLREQPVPPEQSLVELRAPARVGLVAELVGEREVRPPSRELGRGEQLDAGIGVTVLLHEQVAVERAGGHDEAHRTELVERRAKLPAQWRRRVNEQAAVAESNDRHVPAHLHAEEPERNSGDP